MLGKVTDSFLRRAILPHTGAPSPDVIVGPRVGVDAAVLKVGDRLLVVAEDPIFPGPTTSPEDYGWIIVHIGASDVAVMGVRPEFMTYTLLLPPLTPDDYTERLVRSISDTARELGIAIVGGHTGFYSAVTVPTIGGITVWGMGTSVITPAGAAVGDLVLVTKGAAIETAGILAVELGERLLSAGVSEELVGRARRRFKEMSVVLDAQVATAIGGVHAMHDATEGGVARGLWEVAEASAVGLEVEREQLPVPPDVAAVCDHFGLNPYEVISEGTLVLTCEPEAAGKLIEAFQEHGIESAVCGRVVPLSQGRYWLEKNGAREPLIPPAEDRFWEVYFNALALQSDTQTPAARMLCAELGQAVTSLITANITGLIPEVGANIAYAGLDACSPEEVAAIPGRLVRAKDRVLAVGQPEMGGSEYMSETLLIAREFFPEVRSVMNLKNSPRILQACSRVGLRSAEMPAAPDYRQSHDDYRRALRALLAGCSSAPDIVDIPDRINLERLILVFADHLDRLVDKVTAIAAALPEGGSQ